MSILDSPLLTERQLALALHITRSTIARWRMRNEGPTYLKIGGCVRYRPEDIEIWLGSQCRSDILEPNPKRLGCIHNQPVPLSSNDS